MDQCRDKLTLALSTLQYAANPDLASLIIAYVTAVISALTGYITVYVEQQLETVDNLMDRVSDLENYEKERKLLEPSKIADSPTQPSAITANAATTRSNRNIRCNRCHARGHVQKDCKSQNPGVVRKRVDTNQKAKAAASLAANMTHSQLHSFPPPPVHAFMASAPPLSPQYLALAADAAELRRRAEQSARDKKRTRRTASTPKNSLQ